MISNLEFFIQPNFQSSVKMEYSHFQTFMISKNKKSVSHKLIIN